MHEKDLFITLIDLHNAFGEVHHSLLNKVLEYRDSKMWVLAQTTTFLPCLWCTNAVDEN